MPRKKSDAPTAPKERKPRASLLPRFLVHLLAMNVSKIIEGDQAGAYEAEAEIDQLVVNSLAGEARETVLALIKWAREDAEIFAGRFVQPPVIDGVADVDWNHAEREDTVIHE